MTSPNELHFTVSQNGVEDPAAQQHDNSLPSPTETSSGLTLKHSAHPTVCIFHVLFKGLALFLYIFGGWFAGNGNGGSSGANFITVTVCCMLLLAADFWVVKNITGRLLVGLRWWNQVEGDNTKWIFESAENRPANKFDNGVFWTVLYATPAVWGGLLFIAILKFNLGWLIIVIMAMVLSGANVYGYYKCSSDQKVKFQQMIQSGAQAGAMSALRSGMLGFFAGQEQPQQTFV
jgi:hypothetical protein